jgi:hypothetical protein
VRELLKTPPPEGSESIWLGNHVGGFFASKGISAQDISSLKNCFNYGSVWQMNDNPEPGPVFTGDELLESYFEGDKIDGFYYRKSSGGSISWNNAGLSDENLIGADGWGNPTVKAKLIEKSDEEFRDGTVAAILVSHESGKGRWGQGKDFPELLIFNKELTPYVPPVDPGNGGGGSDPGTGGTTDPVPDETDPGVDDEDTGADDDTDLGTDDNEETPTTPGPVVDEIVVIPPAPDGDTSGVVVPIIPLPTIDNVSKVELTDDAVNTAIEKVLESAAENNTVPILEIEARPPAENPEDVKTVEVEILADSMRAVAESGVEEIKITTVIGDVVLDKAAIEALSDQATGAVTLSIGKLDDYR